MRSRPQQSDVASVRQESVDAVAEHSSRLSVCNSRFRLLLIDHIVAMNMS